MSHAASREKVDEASRLVVVTGEILRSRWLICVFRLDSGSIPPTVPTNTQDVLLLGETDEDYRQKENNG
jgi:hypothetical protein